MEEQWRQVESWPEYWVSDHGRVLSIERYARRDDGAMMFVPRRELRQYRVGARREYRAVTLTSGKAHVRRRVAHLVLEAFVGPRPEGTEACHGDGDPLNNHVANLRWDTRSANIYDAVRHGTHPQTRRTHCRRGHPLAAPNLTKPTTRPMRLCLACNRAWSAIRYAKQRGRPHQGMQVESDRYFRTIVAEKDSDVILEKKEV